MALTDTDTTTDWVPLDTFATRLAIVRVQMGGWNYVEAGEATGLSDENWRKWEKGTMPRDREAIARAIADATGCSYEWLMAGGPLRSRCFMRPVPAYLGQLELPMDARPDLVIVAP